MTVEAPAYPVQFEVGEAAPQGRLSILLRAILIIPHVIILSLLGIAVGIVIMLAWFAIVFAGRFPAALVRFTIGYARWAARVNAYGSLLTGAYPLFSMDEEPDYPVRLIVPERTTGRSRLTTFFRCLLLIPHEIVLYFLGIVAMFVGFAAWLAGVVLGRVPGGLHSFLVGYTRWTERASAYAYLLVDDYPPFSFE